MKKYPLSLSPQYCAGWTAANAIREIIQNALDSPDTFEYNIGYSSIEITTKGTSLDPSTLLLGVTSKANDKSSVGGFGEGYKLALLILTRLGHPVYILNGKRLWTPVYEYSDLFKTDMLVINESNAELDNDDLTFVIEDVGYALKQEVIHDCLYLQDDLGEVLQGERGRVLKDRSGELFVGGLFVSKIPQYQHSYDFKPEYLSLNRDRKSVEDWDLKKNISLLLEEVETTEEIADRIEEGHADVYYTQYNVNSDTAEVVYERFQKEYGDDAILAESSTHEKELKESGFNNVVVLTNNIKVATIKQSRGYNKSVEDQTEELPEKEVDERKPLDMLEDWFYSYRLKLDTEAEQKFKEILDILDTRGVEWYE